LLSMQPYLFSYDAFYFYRVSEPKCSLLSEPKAESNFSVLNATSYLIEL
jgi:hypothetical protein